MENVRKVMDTNYYILRSSPLGVFGVVWLETVDGPKVCRVCLPNKKDAVLAEIAEFFPGAVERSHPCISELGDRIQSYLGGALVGFDIGILDRRQCYRFQKRVLIAEYKIPWGWVSTYGRIAKHIGKPGGARAVGNGSGRNPFPIVIPCHRVVRSDGALGGYRGGLAMKRALLEMEGVEFTTSGKVVMDRIYY